MSVEKWYNEICGRDKREKPRVNSTQIPFRPLHGVTGRELVTTTVV